MENTSKMLKSHVCDRAFVKMEEAVTAQEDNVNKKSVKVSVIQP